MTQLPIIIFGTPAWHLGAKTLKWLLEQHNTTIANAGAVWKDFDPKLYPDARFIADMFGYPESWKRMRDTYEIIRFYLMHEKGNMYYHNCGDGNWAGLDEPGSRGDIADKPFSLGRAYQEIKMVLALMPGLKPVVTHPVDARFRDFGASIVSAFRLEYLLKYNLADFGFKGDEEIWAYLNAADLDRVLFGGVGDQMRQVGAKCLLINTEKGTTKHLMFQDSKGLWQPTAEMKALWEGMA